MRYGALRAPFLILALLLSFEARAEIPYEVELVGIEAEELRETLRSASRLVATQDRPPLTVGALRRRIEADLPRLEDALASFGYYGAVLDYRIDTGARPARVDIAVATGPLFRLTGFDIFGPSPALSDGSIVVRAEDLGLERGQPAVAAEIVEGQRRLLATLARQGYPLARVEDRRVVVDHAAADVRVALRLDTGPFARFGPAEVRGLESVEEAFVLSRLAWRQGEPFDMELVERSRRTLIETGLFSAVSIAHAGMVGSGGQLPVTIELAEARHRSIGLGAGYSSSEGLGAEAFWEHRNLRGAGERLRVTATGSQQSYGASANLRLPGIANPDRTLFFELSAVDEDREGFEGLTAGATAGLEFRFSETMTGSGAVSLEYLDLEDSAGTQRFTLLGLPLALQRDTTTDLLDPRGGGRLAVELTPYLSLLGDDASFLVARLTDSIYLPLDEEGDILLAGWARIGSILGDSTGDIPAAKRFYAGGGGSIRAYGFQELGPVDAAGDPRGGRSLVEFGGELRARLFEDIGGVAFLEAGNVYEDPHPDLGERLFWGAGVGLRYFTGFGPVRLDLAVPINPRPQDDPFQVYLSLGQAF